MEDLVFNYLTCGDEKAYLKLSTMNRISVQLFMLFMGVAVHRYKWTGLPKELKAFNLEKVLNYYGYGVFFKAGDKYLFTPCANMSLLNEYNEPIKVRPIGMNGVDFPEVVVNTAIDRMGDMGFVKNAVLIRNNDMYTSTYAQLKPVIDRLTFIWESLGINEGMSRIKAIIHANKDISGVIRTEIKKIIGSGDAFPVVNEKTNILENIEKVDLDVAYTPELYWTDFEKTFMLACEMIGITSNSVDKKERLIVAEVESNDELTTCIEDCYKEYRDIGCEDIKEIFGLEVKVENKNAQAKTTQPQQQVQSKDNYNQEE